jgi:hypothetical protein
MKIKTKLSKAAIATLFLSLLCGVFGLSALPASAEGTLGLAFTNTESTNGFVNSLHGGQSLWFVVPPGGTQSRELLISSSGTVPEQVDMSLVFLGRNADGQYLDRNKVPDSAAWVKFSPQKFVLKPKTTASVKMTYTIPADEPISSHEAYVLATASGASGPSKAQYSVPQAIAISRPIFLGVGTEKSLAPTIDVIDLFGEIHDGKSYLALQIKNSGKVPFSFSGTLDMVDSRFSNRKFSDIKFISQPLAPGGKTNVLIPAPEGLTEGKYDISLTALLGSNEINKIWLGKLIKFTPIFPLFQVLTRVLLAVIFLLILAFSLRYLRRPKNADKKSRADKSAIPEVGQDELDQLIEAMMKGAAKKAAKKSTVKKPVRKAAKKSAKKPVKKAAKKSALKKPVKKAAKKSAVKKPVKKAAKKSAVKKPVKKAAKKIAKNPNR